MAPLPREVPYRSWGSIRRSALSPLLRLGRPCANSTRRWGTPKVTEMNQAQQHRPSRRTERSLCRMRTTQQGETDYETISSRHRLRHGMRGPRHGRAGEGVRYAKPGLVRFRERARTTQTRRVANVVRAIAIPIRLAISGASIAPGFAGKPTDQASGGRERSRTSERTTEPRLILPEGDQPKRIDPDHQRHAGKVALAVVLGRAEPPA